MAQESRQEQAKQWGQVVAKAWQDAAFKQRLLSDPQGVLQEHGVQVPAGIQVRVVENTAQVVHLVLPQRPADLSAEQLDEVAGGGGSICSFVTDAGCLV
jgi:hypothetical protein